MSTCKSVALHIDSNGQRQCHLGRHLNSLGFEHHKAVTLQAAKKKLRERPYDLALIHFDTARKQLFELCSLIRSGDPCAIIIVVMTETQISIEEKLFDLGVNDVVIGKQATARVLAKRIRAHLHHFKSTDNNANKIRLKNSIVDFDRMEIWCNGTIRQLRGILPDLLKYFLANPDYIISRDELQKSPIWADSICTSRKEEGRTFDMAVGKLRKAIEADPANPEIILSVRGKGWKLAKNLLNKHTEKDE